MKGVIFTELVQFMEQNFGIIFVDEVLTQADLPGGGAFTSVGSYPSSQALKIVTIASEKSGVPLEELCQNYGSFLFDRFGELFPDIMELYDSADALLSHVGPHIHEEVRILYRDAQPPSVTTEKDGDTLIVTYESHRPLGHIAYGLIRRSLEVYKDPRSLTWEVSPRADRAVFRLAPA
ncbi:hypothetical protein B2G71_22020 [Novosphingobium sp. PC22D]|nr:hypothetical protein B2G71_22020 [Novosphingobium sp. PC22D]